MPRFEVTREQHEAPESVQRMLRLAGGLNRFGKPNYRLVWGWSRLDWIGGEWIDKDRSGNFLRRVVELRRVPKYLPHARWHLEQWQPPERYGSPRMWRMETIEIYNGIPISALGPYPQMGDYEHSLTLDEPCKRCIQLNQPGKCEHRGFVQLTCQIAERLARVIEFGKSFKESEKLDAIKKRDEWERMQDDKAVDAVLEADPAEIPLKRRQYLNSVLVPQLEQAMANAARRKQQGFNPTGYKVSSGPL